MPYYIGDVIKDQNRLIARTPEEFRKRGVDVHLNREVVWIDVQKNIVHTKDGDGYPYDFLVIGTGTKPFVPDIPGRDLPGVFSLKNLEDALHIKSWLHEKNARRVVIIGGGFIGLEMSEALQAAGISTTIIHKDPLPANRWDQELSSTILDELVAHGVEFIGSTQAKAIEPSTNSALKIVTDAGIREAEMVLLAVGVRPDVSLAKAAGLNIGQTGAITVNFAQQTSAENIYAVGDCCESWNRISRRWVHIPLGDIANKQGRIAGRNIGGRPMTFGGIVGAQSFRLFNLECAATGLSEKEALAAGFMPISNITWGSAMAPAMGMKK